jgi:hypothetical protein
LLKNLAGYSIRFGKLEKGKGDAETTRKSQEEMDWRSGHPGFVFHFESDGNALEGADYSSWGIDI